MTRAAAALFRTALLSAAILATYLLGTAWACADFSTAPSSRWSLTTDRGASWLVTPCGERFFSLGVNVLDGGYAAAAEFVTGNWTERMRKHRRPLRDPKTMLQEWAQANGLPTPVYREIERTGPHHDPQFRVAVDLPGFAPAEGIGGSKRAAEKVAASVMIEREGVGGNDR